MKLVTIVGARPQFVKAAAVSRALEGHAGITEVLVHTGQHYDANMSEVFFSELGIPAPRHWLGIGSGSHGDQTGRMLAAIETVLVGEHPDCVLVYGDTNSTLAGALAAAKLHIPVAHVEAGLRSFNRAMPEEINRVVTDHLSDWLYAPTSTAVANLAHEGIAGKKVLPVGDVMLDAALFHASHSDLQSGILESLGLSAGGFVLATVHRAENTDDAVRLAEVFAALNTIAGHERVVMPIHPRTRQALIQQAFTPAPGLCFIDPVGYIDMVALECGARLVVTDSGGVQKEAFFHRVPCVTLRAETEWTELVESGWNTLVPPTGRVAMTEGVLAAMARPLPADWPPFYGVGDAAAKIAAALAKLTGHVR